MTEPNKQPPPTDSASQVEAAASAIARDAAATERAASQASKPRAPTPPWVAVVAVLALIASVVANWNALRGPVFDPDEERQEGLRTLEFFADRIQQVAVATGTLPASLADAGLPGADATYQVTARGFRLALPLVTGDSVALTRSFPPSTR